jgi:ABC-type lipoprotein export system ATPase subunit
MTDPDVTARPLGELIEAHPRVAAFLATLAIEVPPRLTLDRWLTGLGEEVLADLGMDRGHIRSHLDQLLAEGPAGPRTSVASLTLIGGRDKTGRDEAVELTLPAGEIVCIVGPTGSGKSRLLADVECLAQGDTPTGRRILIDGRPPAASERFAPRHKLVAQLSQTMTFVVDLSVDAFVTLHARCRGLDQPEAVAARVIDCANDLAGERFDPGLSVTQLSGGQTRALMIADCALLGASPIVLIDEIENAGVDRKRALDLLVAEDKIVLISTHDPLIALRGARRLVIRAGGIAEVIDTSDDERRALIRLERIDAEMMAIRDRLRRGGRLNEEDSRG